MSNKTRNQIQKIKFDPNNQKGPLTSSSVLSRMFNKMVIDFGYSDFNSWDRLMNQYVNDARNCIPRNKKEQSSARGNLQKELLKPEMTWKVFLKGIRFLGISSFEFKINAKHSNGKHTTHSHNVNLGDPIPMIPIEYEQQIVKPESLMLIAKHINGKESIHFQQVDPEDAWITIFDYNED